METSVDKCLAFCQALAMSGQKFSFTLSIGKDNFAFTNKELGPSSCMKKKSPSQIRRELRRKEERSLKKAAEPTEKVVEASESDPIVSTVGFQCSQCDSSFKAEEDLNAHIGEVHSAPVLPTPEKERAPDQIADLKLTPPVHNMRTEFFVAPSEKVLRCSYRRCNQIFNSIEEKWSHEEEISMSGPGYFGKLHSGPGRNVEERGLK